MFTKTIANIIASLASAYMTLLAAGALPDTKLFHWLSVGVMFAMQFMVNMGFNRTPNGTVIPAIAKTFIDNSADVELKVDTPSR